MGREGGQYSGSLFCFYELQKKSLHRVLHLFNTIFIWVFYLGQIRISDTHTKAFFVFLFLIFDIK